MNGDPVVESQLSPLKRAFLALEETQAKLDAVERAKNEPIAIIGAACRFPGGASDMERLWELLCNGVDATGEIPPERWDVDSYSAAADSTDTIQVNRGAFLQEPVDQFDPQFFGIAPREARGIDPQQRLLLEVGWEALESAGIAPDKLVGTRTGVFVGVCASDYNHIYIKSEDPSLFNGYYASGVAHSIASGRLSYALGLQGPSITVDTACSSSLTALHLAVRSLRDGESDMAMTGGVNLILSPENHLAFSAFGMLAPDGHCKTFDASADGFGRGEGCGLIVLKRLSDALAHHDTILALIRGTAANQDGASGGLTVPNGPAQAAVIEEALRRSEIEAHLISYIEAHGTGTKLGDPIEVQAMDSVFGGSHSPQKPVLIGSVKTNMGHLEAAAGIAGVLKVVLALQHRMLPAHLHFHEPNPLIPWEKLPFKVPTQLTPWEAIEGRRIAGVSAFGFSGTNVHVVLEEAPESSVVASAKSTRSAHLLALSGKSETALRELAGRWYDHLTANAELAIEDVCFTANTGRAHLNHRLAVLGATTPELSERLNAFANAETAPAVISGAVEPAEKPKIGFMFTGQGSQYVGMGRQLYETEPVFRAALDRCATILTDDLEKPLLSVLYPEGDGDALLDDTTYTQPALFAIEYALAKLWQAWGVEPSVVMGHSVGEYVAATLAGVFSLEDGLKLIAARGKLMGSLPSGGAMAAVFAGEATVREALEPYRATVSIASVNGPAQTVISGEHASVRAVVEALQTVGIASRMLKVSHAFHSPLMEPMLDAFERIVSDVRTAAPQIRLVSNITGKFIDGELLSQPGYWRRHAREAVQFAASVETMREHGVQVFLEIGPNPTLTAMGQRCLEGSEQACLWAASLKQKNDDWRQMLDSLATLYCHGVAVDWAALDDGEPRRRLSLPTYAFQRQSYWLSKKASKNALSKQTRGKREHPLLGQRLRSALSTMLFEATMSSDDLGFLHDHRINGLAVLPGAAFVEAALAAAKIVLPGGSHSVNDLVIHEALAVADGETRVVQWILTPNDEGEATFECYSQADDDTAWQLHARAQLMRGASENPPRITLGAVKARCTEHVKAEEHYQQLKGKGLEFGPSLRGVTEVWRTDGEALGLIAVPSNIRGELSVYGLHPAVLDAHLQVLAEALPAGNALYLPFSMDTVRVFKREVVPVWSYVILEKSQTGKNETIRATVSLLAEHGEVVAEINGLHLRQAKNMLPSAGDQYDNSFYEVCWERSPRPGAEPMVVSPMGKASNRLSLGQIEPSLQSAFEGLKSEYGITSAASAADRALDRLSLAYITRAFRQLGWNSVAGADHHCEVEALAEQLKIIPKYQRLLSRLLALLAEESLARAVGSAWELKALPDDDPENLVASLRSSYPSHRHELAFVSRCGAQLAEVLRGQVDPLQLLFLGGDQSTAETLYRESINAKVFNELAQAALGAILKQRPVTAPLRVLEVGGGTGGTTSYLLPVLPKERGSYLFTDISPLFAARAEKNFKQYGLRSGVFNIEQHPATQDLEGQQFDLIVAANVIHATANLSTALSHLREVLAPGGLLLMLETTKAKRWVDITFGLTDGWWRFEDTALRDGYPTLSAEKWKAFLSHEGFDEIVSCEGDGDALLLARRVAENADSGASAIGLTKGHWLLFTDDQSAASPLADQLEQRGASCTLVPVGVSLQARDGSISVDPLKRDDYERIVHKATSERPLTGVIHMIGAGRQIDDAQDGGVDNKLERACASAMHLVQGLAQVGSAPRLWLITRGAQPVGPGKDLFSPAAAALWGLGKTLAFEHPELDPAMIDLDSAVSIEEARLLVEEILAPDGETQIAFRAEERFVARLKPSTPDNYSSQSAAVDSEPVRLEISQRGSLENLALKPTTRTQPGPGEVEIRVRAAGLNFRDVLNSMGMYPGAENRFGGECAGEISALGPGVSGFQLGDQVVALATGALGTYVNASATMVLPKPVDCTFDQAASLPIAFITADFTLRHVAQLKVGERVLIHAAAGGVGLAAVQIAQQAGAEIFATAGVPQKRAYLRSLGIPHVLDSRSLAFADEIMAATRGQGVDVVLNSLAGEFIPASLSVLAQSGRFVEMGKSGLLSQAQIEALGEGRSYHIIDWSETAQQDPALIHSIFVRVMDELETGRLRPLPFTVFGLSEAQMAFRYMAQARQIGKLVLTQAEPNCGHSSAGEISFETSFRTDATYLITGGLGGLGLVVARWMVKKGARHLVLVGRREASQRARQTIEELERAGASVTMMPADISKECDVAGVLSSIDASPFPLKGIIHAAGVLADGILLNQDWRQFSSVLEPKAQGSWHLHQLTKQRPLDFFVLFSSISSLLGSPGQGNHSAANAFMDALAYYRRGRGLPAVSINWGAWSEVGSVIDHNVQARTSDLGIGAISTADGLRCLGQVIVSGPAQIGFSPMTWTTFLRELGAKKNRYFSAVASPRQIAHGEKLQATASTTDNLATHIAGLSETKRRGMVIDFVKQCASKVLDLNAQTISERIPLNELGLDSLMAVELRNVLGNRLGQKNRIPATLVFDYPTIEAISDYLLREFLTPPPTHEAITQPPAHQPLEEAQAMVQVPVQGDDDILAAIEDLSDEEVDRLLAQKKQRN